MAALLLRRGWGGLRWLARQLTLTGWLAVLLCVAVLILLGTCSYQSQQKVRESRERAAAEVRALEVARRADGRAADQARIDTIIVRQKEKELTDAVQGFPDAAPSAARRALACQRLRQQSSADAAASAGC